MGVIIEIGYGQVDDVQTNEDESLIEQRIKVIIVGDPGSGKKDVAKGTDICVPFKSLGVSIGKKTNLDKKINYQLTLIFWTLTDNRPKQTTYFTGASAAIIVGNLFSKQSVQKMRYWAESVSENLGEIPIFFIGTKKKFKSTRNIDYLAKLAFDYKSDYYILLSSEEDALKRIFQKIAKKLAKNYLESIQPIEAKPT